MKIKWEVGEVPTGQYRSFQERSWPMGFHQNGEAAIMLQCADEYSRRAIKEAKHPIYIYLAQHHKDPKVRAEKGGFTWRKLKTAPFNLKEAKEIGIKALETHLEFLPEGYDKEPTV